MLSLQRAFLIGILATSIHGCASYTTVRELKLVGFEEDVGKGKSLGQIEGGDCVFHIFGYWLGGQPTLSRAFTNAQHQRTTSLADAGGGDNPKGDSVRYMNNITVKDDGFNAMVFGKKCIMVSGTAFK